MNAWFRIMSDYHQSSGNRRQGSDGNVAPTFIVIPAKAGIYQCGGWRCRLYSRLCGNDKDWCRHLSSVFRPLSSGTARSQKAGWCGLHTSSSKGSCLPNRNGNNTWIPACAGMTEEGSVLCLLVRPSKKMPTHILERIFSVGQCPTYTTVVRIDDGC